MRRDRWDTISAWVTCSPPFIGGLWAKINPSGGVSKGGGC